MNYLPPLSRTKSTPALLKGEYRQWLHNRNTGYTSLVSHEKPSHRYLSELSSVSSGGHYGWQKPSAKQDVGGPFYLERSRVLHAGSDSVSAVTPWPGLPWMEWEVEYNGGLTPLSVSQMSPPPMPVPDESQTSMWGAELIDKCAPGDSPMSLAVSLAELKKDGIPSIFGKTMKSQASVFRKAGNEYLNVEFGWKPFANDLNKLALTTSLAGETLSQLERDAGRVVRRRARAEPYFHEETTSLGYHPICLGGNLAGPFGGGDVTVIDTTTRDVWFSGAFTYYLPKNYSSRNKVVRAVSRANKLLGLELTPRVVWNAAPWSWAADWFTNADEVISNTQRFVSEGLVMYYGYLMVHTTANRDYTTSHPSGVFSSFTQETKVRVKANPFGFGVNWDSLSGFQASIVAALGISRGR